jgi:hypothetical protein
MTRHRWYTTVVLVLAALILPSCGEEEEPGVGKQDAGPAADAPVPVQHGFGDYCTPVVHECNQGLFCSKEMGQQIGFCTKNCSVQNEACDGTPEGALAKCIMYIASTKEYGCVFLCGKSYRCPAGLVCREDKELGGGLYWCLGE